MDLNLSASSQNKKSDASKKLLFIKDLKPRDQIHTSFLVKSKQMVTARNGKPYLSLILSDCTGDIDTRVWEDADNLNEMFQEGDIIAVGGKAQQFQNRMQLIVEHLVPLPFNELNVSDYVPASTSDREAQYRELVEIFEKLKSPWVRELGLQLLQDPEIAPRYQLCPAAKTIHHAFIGGLLAHSLQIVHLIDALLPFYQNLDRDLLVFGAAFHDFGKIFELNYHGKFDYSDEGKLVGHITIAVNLMDRKIQKIPDFPKELEWQLKHLILSHHGKLEYGSPKRPHTIEAEILTHLDAMDSKIQAIQSFMQAERNSNRWTAHHKAYDQYYYKPDCYLQDDCDY